MRPLANFVVSLLSVISLIFLTWGSVKHLRGSFLRKRLAEFSRWLFPSESSVLDVWQFSKYIFNSIFALPCVYFQLFISLFCIPLFYHTCFNFFKWAFLCHPFWSWVTLLLTLDYFYIISFYLILYMTLTCSKSVY